MDAADTARMGESAKTFKQIMSHKLLSNKPVLLVGNKQDVDGAVTGEALRSTFGVAALQNVMVSCFSVKAKSEAARAKSESPEKDNLSLKKDNLVIMFNGVKTEDQ